MTTFAQAVLPCLQIEGKVYGRMSKLAVELLKEFDNRSDSYRHVIPNENFLDVLACYLMSHKDKAGFSEKNRNAYLKIVIRRMTKYVDGVMAAAHSMRAEEEKISKMSTGNEDSSSKSTDRDK